MARRLGSNGEWECLWSVFVSFMCEHKGVSQAPTRGNLIRRLTVGVQEGGRRIEIGGQDRELVQHELLSFQHPFTQTCGNIWSERERGGGHSSFATALPQSSKLPVLISPYLPDKTCSNNLLKCALLTHVTLFVCLLCLQRPWLEDKAADDKHFLCCQRAP